MEPIGEWLNAQRKRQAVERFLAASHDSAVAQVRTRLHEILERAEVEGVEGAKPLKRLKGEDGLDEYTFSLGRSRFSLVTSPRCLRFEPGGSHWRRTFVYLECADEATGIAELRSEMAEEADGARHSLHWWVGPQTCLGRWNGAVDEDVSGVLLRLVRRLNRIEYFWSEVPPRHGLAAPFHIEEWIRPRGEPLPGAYLAGS